MFTGPRPEISLEGGNENVRAEKEEDDVSAGNPMSSPTSSASTTLSFPPPAAAQNQGCWFPSLESVPVTPQTLPLSCPPCPHPSTRSSLPGRMTNCPLPTSAVGSLLSPVTHPETQHPSPGGPSVPIICSQARESCSLTPQTHFSWQCHSSELATALGGHFPKIKKSVK